MNLPRQNIDWTEVHRLKNSEIGAHEVEDMQSGEHSYWIHIRGGIRNALIIWSSHDAQAAQAYLRQVAFARCKRADCGVRVAKLGDECGNHGKGGAA